MITLSAKKNEFDERIFTAEGEDKDFRCKECGFKIEINSEAFVCENNLNFVLCPKCQNKDNMRRFKHDKRGEHRQIKFIRVKNDE